MLVQFFEETETKIFSPDKILRLSREFHPQDLFWLCECLHLNTGHGLCKGKCYYEKCQCQQFTPKEFKITCVITKSDIFSFENPDLIYDSPTWWTEFEKWENLNAK